MNETKKRSLSDFSDFDGFDILDESSFKEDSETKEQIHELDELKKRIGEEYLGKIDEETVHIPKIPRLTRSMSIGSSYVSTLYLSPGNIDDPANVTKAEISISIINDFLSKSNLYWNVTFNTIREKLLNNREYLGNTLYGIWRLADAANLAMFSSLKRKEDKEDSNTLIIDYSNFKFGLGRCDPKVYPGDPIAEQIDNWIIEKMGPCDRIIISIQQNDIPRPEFLEFRMKLKDTFGHQNIIIIVGSDASSYDDFNIAYIVTKLLPLSKKYIISDDKFNDICKLEKNIDGTPRKSFIFIRPTTTDKIIMVNVKDFCGKYDTYRSPPSTFSRPAFKIFARRGGTNKNKYTRKIKNSKKVKTLHKKRNTSKKVVKKYNKNYKKKTLRRKNK